MRVRELRAALKAQPEDLEVMVEGANGDIFEITAVGSGADRGVSYVALALGRSHQFKEVGSEG